MKKKRLAIKLLDFLEQGMGIGGFHLFLSSYCFVKNWVGWIFWMNKEQ